MNAHQSTATVSTGPALRFAAINAAQAPSIFNTQPWRWQIGPARLALHADRTRQLRIADPEGRLLAISCGAALHHARTVRHLPRQPTAPR